MFQVLCLGLDHGPYLQTLTVEKIRTQIFTENCLKCNIQTHITDDENNGLSNQKAVGGGTQRMGETIKEAGRGEGERTLN